MQKFLFLLLIFPLSLFSQNIDVETIVKKADDILRGRTNYSLLTMEIKTPRWKRTVKMESWSMGDKKSFIRILYPKKDKGVTFLKLDNEMWQYVPKIEKIIKIPPSMMLQSWMGSDFTNDDLVKESSIIDDYHKKLLSEDDENWTIELIPKEEAAIVWAKLLVNIDKKTYLFKNIEFYDEENFLVRVLHYENVKEVSGRLISTLWRVEPKSEEKKGNSTTVFVEKMVFDEPIDDIYFTKRALKKFSIR